MHASRLFPPLRTMFRVYTLGLLQLGCLSCTSSYGYVPIEECHQIVSESLRRFFFSYSSEDVFALAVP